MTRVLLDTSVLIAEDDPGAVEAAISVASLAEPWMTPPPRALVLRNVSGNPSSSCIQSHINVSTSVHAGLVTQLMPCTASPEAARSHA